MYNKYSAPTSPTLSARTTSSIAASTRTDIMNDPVVMLSRTDLRSSIEAYEALLNAAKIYRNQMIMLASASAGFGQALERIARCKGALEAGPSLQAAAGLHYLISNHQQVLSDTFYKNFEIPLLENLDTHKASISSSEEHYDKACSELSRQIKETEAENLRSGRKRQRDLTQFRRALRDLTQQVEKLDHLKSEYYHQMLDTEQSNINHILQATSTIVRAEVDIYERISSKGLADPLLESMSTNCADPFCVYTTADEQSEIFSVLPPVPIINPIGDMNSMAASPLTDLSAEDAAIYPTFAASNLFQPRLSTQTEDEAENGSFKSENMRSRDSSKRDDGNQNDISGNCEMRDGYKQPHTYSKLTSATPSTLPLSLGSDAPSINRDFNRSTQCIHISDDAELLQNKEFSYGVDDNGFESGQMGSYTATRPHIASGMRSTSDASSPSLLKAYANTSAPLATVVEQ